ADGDARSAPVRPVVSGVAIAAQALADGRGPRRQGAGPLTNRHPANHSPTACGQGGNMGTKPSDSGARQMRIEADVLGVGKDDQPPALVAYAFSQSGRLLSRTELKGGKAEVSTPSTKEPEAVRVLIG